MLVQLQGPPLSRPHLLPTCIHIIYINYIHCIHHLPTPPTSYPTAPATTRPPLLLLTSGVQHTPRRPRPRPAACPCSGLPSPRCLKCQATDLTTLDAIPINHRKRSFSIFSSPTSFLHRLLLSVPSQPDRPHDCMLAISPALMGCMGPQDTQPQETGGRTTRNAHLVLTGGLPTADMQFRPQNKEAMSRLASWS